MLPYVPTVYLDVVFCDYSFCVVIESLHDCHVCHEWSIFVFSLIIRISFDFEYIDNVLSLLVNAKLVPFFFLNQGQPHKQTSQVILGPKVKAFK